MQNNHIWYNLSIEETYVALDASYEGLSVPEQRTGWLNMSPRKLIKANASAGSRSSLRRLKTHWCTSC